MVTDNQFSQPQENSEVSLTDITDKLKEWKQFLASKKKTILSFAVLGLIAGIIYAFTNKPVYEAKLTFALQDEKSSNGGLGSALGLASQFGIDLGAGGVGGEFSGDNLLELMKSRRMVEKTLLSPVNVNGHNETLADLYIDFNNLRTNWFTSSKYENIHYPLNSDPAKFSLKQDSILGVFYKDILKKNLIVDKIDKKLSIIVINVSSTNEAFSKSFTEQITKNVSEFYIQTKTKKALKNFLVLQNQLDSVRRKLNGSISDYAQASDLNPSPNAFLQTLRVPSQKKQIDVTANNAILGEYVKNVEMARMALLQETPLIQVIDTPILPLEKTKTSKVLWGILGFVLTGLLASVILLIRKKQ